jgi:hypothetical protein
MKSKIDPKEFNLFPTTFPHDPERDKSQVKSKKGQERRAWSKDHVC